jgi:uncharacterized membrane protein YpjA
MAVWARAILFGLLSWFIPFAMSLVLFPIRKSNAPLFSALMYLMVLVTAGVLLINYFRKRPVSLREALLVGALWLVMNLLLDYPKFAYGPMRMSAVRYCSEIGIVYLTFPAFALLAVRMPKR